MQQLIKGLLSARHGRTDFVDHPNVTQIRRRLPEDLIEWFERVIYIERDPLDLLCGPRDRSDAGYHEIWRYKRDRDHPDLDPNNPDVGPEGGDDGDPDGAAGAPFAP
jgi:hypothetical protein